MQKSHIPDFHGELIFSLIGHQFAEYPIYFLMQDIADLITFSDAENPAGKLIFILYFQ
jgi:hypothetical protein